MNYLTATQAAARLKITTGRIRQLILANRLKALKVGQFWLIKPADLKAIKYGKPGRPRKKESTRGK